jgi:hypothetical protein
MHALTPRCVMSYTPMRWTKPAVWAKSKREFVRQSAFSLIAGLAVHGTSCRPMPYSAVCATKHHERRGAGTCAPAIAHATLGR